MQVKTPINRPSFVRRPSGNFRSRGEPGFVIILVAVFLLFVVGAMAALSIDVVTFYTARSEAQLAADGAALAGARVLANSGVTSDINSPGDGMLAAAQLLAGPVAKQVAISNSFGGRNLLAAEVTVNFNGSGNNPCSADPQLQVSNPCVTVTVTRTDLPVFFARIWGSTQAKITASATAEAFNPSGLATDVTASLGVPVAPSCVKPWLLPNIDPTTGNPIFDPHTGEIQNSALLGAVFPGSLYGFGLHATCNVAGSCNPVPPPKWEYLVGDDSTSFPPPTLAVPACTLSTSPNFQLGIAGCVQPPIICGATGQVNIKIDADQTLDQAAADAVNCLANTSGNQGDTILPTMIPPTPFQFTAGTDNPLVQAGTLTAGSNIVVSNSLVTVPVFDSQGYGGGTSVTVIGFLQLFLQPSGLAVNSVTNQIESKIINMVGCGLNSNAGSTIVPVYGNGATAVPVRLISPP